MSLLSYDRKIRLARLIDKVTPRPYRPRVVYVIRRRFRGKRIPKEYWCGAFRYTGVGWTDELKRAYPFASYATAESTLRGSIYLHGHETVIEAHLSATLKV